MRIPLPAGRLLIYGVLVLGLGLSLLPLGRSTPPVETTHYFTETGHAITGRFLEVWRGSFTYQESVAIVGYPISDVHDEVSPTDGKTYQTQWFERARFEAHPENTPPNDVQLGLLGVAATRTRSGEAPFQPVAQPAGTGPTLAWFPATQHTIRAAFLQFWTRYGAEQQFGFPISEAFDEPNRLDGKTYQVQYFERARFELHPGEAPEFGGVLLGQLGVEEYHGAALDGMPSARLRLPPHP
jgi:hypothetical protein